MSKYLSTFRGPVCDCVSFLFLVWQPSWRETCLGVEQSWVILAALAGDLFWETIPSSHKAARWSEQTHSLALILSEVSWESTPKQTQGVSSIASLQNTLLPLSNQSYSRLWKGRGLSSCHGVCKSGQHKAMWQRAEGGFPVAFLLAAWAEPCSRVAPPSLWIWWLASVTGSLGTEGPCP